MDKVERLANLIAELMYTSRPLTARDIHERLGGYPEDDDSFRRAFERDKKDLREMGVPITLQAVPGTDPVEDGYRIDRAEYELPDLDLDADELAALHLAATAVRLDDRAAGIGLSKLGARAAAGPGDHVAFLGSAPDLARVFEAISARRRLSFRYRGKDRAVDPARLHHEKGRWYVQGHDHASDAVRSFRLDRIEGAMESAAPGSATVDVDVSEHPITLQGWALGDDEPVEARVRITGPQARIASRQVSDDVGVHYEDDEAVVLTFPVRRVDGFRSFVLGFLDDAEVLGPPELRDDIVAWLSSMTAGDAG